MLEYFRCSWLGPPIASVTEKMLLKIPHHKLIVNLIVNIDEQKKAHDLHGLFYHYWRNGGSPIMPANPHGY